MENKPNKFQRETADSFECAYEKNHKHFCLWFSPTPIIHLKVVGHVPKFSFTKVLAKRHQVF